MRTRRGPWNERPRIIPEAGAAACRSRRRIPRLSAWVAANAGSGKTHVLGAARDPAAARRRRSRKNPLHHLHQGRRRQHGEPGVRRRCGAGPRSTTRKLDAAIRADVRPRSPTPALRAGARGCSRWRWRRRAGSRCRPSTPSARGCCISFRSRPMSPRASTCSTTPRRRSSWTRSSLGVLLDAALDPRRCARPRARAPRSRSPPTGPSRRSSPRRSASATSVRAWIEHGGSVGARRSPVLCGHARQSLPTTRSTQVEHEIVAGPLLPSSEWAARRATLCNAGSPSDQEQARAARRRTGGDRHRRASRSYLEMFFDSKLEPRPQSLVTQRLTEHPGARATPRRGTQRVTRLLRAPQGRRLPRPHRPR